MTQLYYCQDDGAQWNIPVDIIGYVKIDPLFVIIVGAELMAPYNTEQVKGIMIVPNHTVWDKPQDDIAPPNNIIHIR